MRGWLSDGAVRWARVLPGPLAVVLVLGGAFYATTSPAPEDVVVVEDVMAVAQDTVLGKQVYSSSCAMCHQANGQGIPATFPPLIGSEWVTGSPEVVIRIVLQGVSGPITVAGSNYNSIMPGWGTQLNDDQVAGVLSYVRQWGANDAPAITPQQVAAVREATKDRTTPWTVAELQAVSGGGD